MSAHRVVGGHGQLTLFGEPQSAFVPPRGQGRCRRCGWHTKKQGHSPDCPILLAVDAKMLRSDIRMIALEARAAGYEVLARQSTEPVEKLKDGVYRIADRAEDIVRRLLKYHMEHSGAVAKQSASAQAYYNRATKNAEKDLAHVVAVSVGEAFEDPTGFYVYILWGDDPEVPVYVGKSTNVFARIGTHLCHQEKRALSRRVQLLRCETRILMDTTEARLIRHYRPLLNIAGLGDD